MRTSQVLTLFDVTGPLSRSITGTLTDTQYRGREIVLYRDMVDAKHRRHTQRHRVQRQVG